MPSTVPFFALTTRGLEDISAAELAGLPGVSVTGVAYRRVIGRCHAPFETLIYLNNVDDV
ncbi:MAG TPA: hypothetical protein VGP82_08770 [Ktedonobacterales bacterium]|jgi:hypothetical protein|nr:hypothetical protein [Ktedonobacterales bacterium]